MTEQEFRDFFLAHPYEANAADGKKNEILRVTTAGFGDEHTSIIRLESGIVKFIACTEDAEDADAVLVLPVSAIENITIPVNGLPCWQFWLAGGGVFQLGQMH